MRTVILSLLLVGCATKSVEVPAPLEPVITPARHYILLPVNPDCGTISLEVPDGITKMDLMVALQAEKTRSSKYKNSVCLVRLSRNETFDYKATCGVKVRRA